MTEKRNGIMDGICKILEGYKGVYVPFGGISLSESCDYVTVRAMDMKGRNMPYASQKILKRYPQIRYVHFTGGWQEHIYTRETLKWLGMYNK